MREHAQEPDLEESSGEKTPPEIRRFLLARKFKCVCGIWDYRLASRIFQLFVVAPLLVKYVGIDYEDLVRASFHMFDPEYRKLSLRDIIRKFNNN